MPPALEPRDPSDAVDISDWTVIGFEPRGQDQNKQWIAAGEDAPRHTYWLWKPRQKTGDGSHDALTDCAEVFVSRLAKNLDLPAAVCEFATRGGERGVISQNVAPEGFSLNTGATYLPEVEGYDPPPDIPQGQRGRMQRDPGYSLDLIARVLQDVQPPPSSAPGLTAFQVFTGYLMLDALVANTDRHSSNWALLEDPTGVRYLAPTFDHGSALGAGLTDANRARRDPARWAARGRANPFAPNSPLLVDLAHDALSRSGQSPWLSRVARLDEATIASTLVAPPGRLSDVAATFIRSVILRNQGRLCDDHVAED